MQVAHQFDFDGNHRLIVNGKDSGWQPYTVPAIVDIKGDLRFTATTEYFGKEQVTVSSIPTVVKDVVTGAAICKVCEAPISDSDNSENENCQHVKARIETIKGWFRKQE